MSMLWTTDYTQVTCAGCGVEYRPALTRGECPLCGLPCPDERYRPRELDPRTRTTLMLIAAAAVNVLMLAVFAAAVLG